MVSTPSQHVALSVVGSSPTNTCPYMCKCGSLHSGDNKEWGTYPGQKSKTRVSVAPQKDSCLPKRNPGKPRLRPFLMCGITPAPPPPPPLSSTRQLCFQISCILNVAHCSIANICSKLDWVCGLSAHWFGWFPCIRNLGTTSIPHREKQTIYTSYYSAPHHGDEASPPVKTQHHFANVPFNLLIYML